MAKDFATLKQQLKELSSIINSFKSEAVQLKIMEWLFGQQGLPVSMEPLPLAAAKPKAKNGRRKRGRGAPLALAAKPGRKPSRKVAGPERPGAVRVLNQLMAEGFFKKPRAIGEVVRYANEKLGMSFKQPDFSGPLVKMSRDKKLSRSPNAEGRFEYVAK